MVLLTTVSLPGMGVADMTTVSPGMMLTSRWSAAGDSHQSRGRLALASGGHDDHLFRRQVSHFSQRRL